MAIFFDQTGRSISLDKAPSRIISLVPSQTELLFDLGVTQEVIGITKFCIHPPAWLQTKTRVGGTKQLKMDIINQLQPDLIIANKEENVKEQIEYLENYFPVWISDVNNLNDAYEMIQQVGIITNKEEAAQEMILQIIKNFVQLQTTEHKLKTAYLIWQQPYMTIGGDSFINAMLETAGFENIFANEKRYPEVSIEQLRNMKPELLLLSSEPFPFKQKHVDELQLQLPGTKIMLADGEMFSWYGSRLLQAPSYFYHLQKELK